MRPWALLGWLMCACANAGNSEPAPEQRRSPNANVMPTPLAERSERLPRPEPTAGGALGGAASSEQGRATPNVPELPPTPLSALQPPEADRDLLVKAKDSQWLVLQALWRWPAPSPDGLEPEADLAVIEEANRALSPQIKIELHPSGRMRWQWLSKGFPLPQDSTLLARHANYGHLLVWPDGSRYRVLTPGVLRAALGERRVDVTPLVLGKYKLLREGKRLGFVTEISELQTAHGSLVLEQIQSEEVGRAGALICRTLVELIAASPTTPACAGGLLPLYAELHLANGGRCAWEVTTLTPKAEGPLRAFMPPRGATFQASGLPAVHGVLLDDAFQQRLHHRDRGEAQSKQTGLVLHNPTPQLAYLQLDRVRIAMLAPHGKSHLSGLRPGRYRTSWHGFFGSVLQEPRTIDVPGDSASAPLPQPDAGIAKP